jgi:hypothetical protein
MIHENQGYIGIQSGELISVSNGIDLWFIVYGTFFVCLYFLTSGSHLDCIPPSLGERPPGLWSYPLQCP